MWALTCESPHEPSLQSRSRSVSPPAFRRCEHEHLSFLSSPLPCLKKPLICFVSVEKFSFSRIFCTWKQEPCVLCLGLASLTQLNYFEIYSHSSMWLLLLHESRMNYFWSTLVAQKVEELALSPWGVRSLPRHRFDPWPGKFCIPWVQAKKKLLFQLSSSTQYRAIIICLFIHYVMGICVVSNFWLLLLPGTWLSLYMDLWFHFSWVKYPRVDWLNHISVCLTFQEPVRLLQSGYTILHPVISVWELELRHTLANTLSFIIFSFRLFCMLTSSCFRSDLFAEKTILSPLICFFIPLVILFNTFFFFLSFCLF